MRSKSDRAVGRVAAVVWSALVVFWDAGLVLAGGTLLWLNGGPTVTSGPLPGLALFVAVMVAGLFVRALLPGRPASAEFSLSSVGFERNVIIGDSVVLLATLIAWMATSLYFLGWLAVLGASLLFIGSMVQFLTDVLTGRASLRAPGRRIRRHPVRKSLEFARMLGMAWAVVALAVLSPIHAWLEIVLNPLVLMLVIAIGVQNALIRTILGRAASTAQRRVGAAIRPRRTERGQLWL
ncbi:hypothetical protein [Leifsonia aquatica]|uniref:hypothetical protein n=1 Tax=Leifsonia aquatica TaxID=144185 RepID=UPI0038241162